jgi:K+-sensing histidine kinase KdpD
MADGGNERNWPALLSLTSHEMKNSLAVLIGYLRMLQGGKAGDLTERQAQFIELMLKSSTSLRSVADQLSELARYEAGNLAEVTLRRRGRVDVAQVLAAAANDLPQIPDYPIQIDIEVTGAIAIDEGDGIALERAFRSLLGRFRSEVFASDRLLVRGGIREVGAERMIWIAIGEEQQLHTLNGATPQNLHTFQLKMRSGWGLSLVLAERIIEAHGGWIRQKLQDTAHGPVIIMLPQVSRLPASVAPPLPESARTSASGRE